MVVALVAGGLSIWSWASRPAACVDANVSSERFGYCITAPTGWRVAEPIAEEPPADQLFRPDGDATLTIQAIDTGRDLSAFASDVRRMQADDGLKSGGIRSLTVAGVDALWWDATLRASGAVRARTVVFERDGVAWRLQFADNAETFDAHAGDLATILRSWRFR